MFNSLLSTGLVLFFLSGGNALAQQDHEHSQNFCSVQNSEICAHLGFLSPVKTTNEVQFYVHAFVPQGLEIQNLKVDLWMDMGNGHGHGSSPVDISKVVANKYKVGNAFFVMPGSWLVRLTFNLGSDTHYINIPVPVIE